MAVPRRNVELAQQLFEDRLGQPYVYGGTWAPDTSRGTDCSGLAGTILEALTKGGGMRWGRMVSTESWPYNTRPGAVGPYGTINIARPQDAPADAAAIVSIHHGGGGPDSHMNIEVDGVLMESSGSHGVCGRGSGAMEPTNGYWNRWWYLPGPIVNTVAPPQYRELDYMTGGGASDRNGYRPINFILHTQEGDGTAESLARYCDGSNNVSYHYTVRDGVVCDVVDTDYASWSVLNPANYFTVNLCFAGSFAAWSREQWLRREDDIAIAAWLAVQDAVKYGFSTEVIAPPYGAARQGFSDHAYITRVHRIGTHTDVGAGFPWDVFASYVKRFTSDEPVDVVPPTQPPQAGGDMFTDEDRKLMREVHGALFNSIKSRSPFRHIGEGAVLRMHQMPINTDAFEHAEYVEWAAERGDENALALLREVATADPNAYPDRREDIKLAQSVLARIGYGATPFSSEQSVGWRNVVEDTKRAGLLSDNDAPPWTGRDGTEDVAPLPVPLPKKQTSSSNPMRMRPVEYSKAIVALLGTFVALASTSQGVIGEMLPEGWSSWVPSAVAFATAAGVFVTKNAPMIDKIGNKVDDLWRDE